MCGGEGEGEENGCGEGDGEGEEYISIENEAVDDTRHHVGVVVDVCCSIDDNR